MKKEYQATLLGIQKGRGGELQANPDEGYVIAENDFGGMPLSCSNKLLVSQLSISLIAETARSAATTLTGFSLLSFFSRCSTSFSICLIR